MKDEDDSIPPLAMRLREGRIFLTIRSTARMFLLPQCREPIWYLYLEKKTLVAQTDKMGVFEMHILSLPTGTDERSTFQFLVVVVVVAKHIPVDFRLRNTYSSM